jgi:hypothetical protein
VKIGHEIVMGLVAGAFSAGTVFALWTATHPSRTEIAEMIAPATSAAKAAQAQAFSAAEQVKALRSDLSRGFGRALALPGHPRDEAGKSALRMFEAERAQGVDPAIAMRHVLESDF